MSINAIGALERGERRYPDAETEALLAAALGLEPAARATFEAVAARPKLPRARADGEVAPADASAAAAHGAVVYRLS